MNRDGRRFPGTVTEVKPATSLEPALFEVTFIDGDVEDYERSELEPLLVTDAQHAINTARYHAEEAAAVAATTATEEPTDPKAASAAGGERKRKRLEIKEKNNSGAAVLSIVRLSTLEIVIVHNSSNLGCKRESLVFYY